MPTSPTTRNQCNLPDYCQLDEYWFEDLEYWLDEFNSRYEEQTYSEEEKRETD